MVICEVSYTTSESMLLINSESDIALAFYPYSTATTVDIGGNFIDSITIIIIPLSPQAARVPLFFSPRDQQLVLGKTLSATTNNMYATVNASIVNYTTIRIDMDEIPSFFGSAIFVTGSDVLFTDQSMTMYEPFGFSATYFHIAAGSSSFIATSDTQFGPYVAAEAYDPTKFTLTATSVTATDISTARIRRLTFNFATVMGGNGGSNIKLRLSTTGCNVDFSMATISGASLALAAISSGLI
mgnify:CR=1 FL=1